MEYGNVLKPYKLPVKTSLQVGDSRDILKISKDVAQSTNLSLSMLEIRLRKTSPTNFKSLSFCSLEIARMELAGTRPKLA